MFIRARQILTIAFAIAAVALSGACSSNNEEGGEASPSEATSGPTSQTVDVTAKDYALAADQTDLSAGGTTFAVANEGPSTHEFVVFKTDLAEDALPVENGEVNEDDPALESMGEVEDVESGATKSFSATLTPGSYVAICNLPGHYEKGMAIAFTVS